MQEKSNGFREAGGWVTFGDSWREWKITNFHVVHAVARLNAASACSLSTSNHIFNCPEGRHGSVNFEAFADGLYVCLSD